MIGIIGGTGLYEMEGVSDLREIKVKTPFGPPSDALKLGRLEGREVVFLPRHGRGHRILPGELNFKANIYALKTLGVEFVLSVSAVGSLKEQYAPLHLVIPDQFVDRTTQRQTSFFGRGLVGHVAFAHPFCSHLALIMAEACSDAKAIYHRGGTYVCIEGPHFSTRAESLLYRSWGMDIIGMTNLQEARLAREAELCYATLAMVTDYDCWHPEHDAVTIEQILGNLTRNAQMAQAVLRAAVKRLPVPRDCDCAQALKYALVTAPALVPDKIKRELAPIIGKYMPVTRRSARRAKGSSRKAKKR
ncbi:MAG: S-methyl-5'-thioadenosine phosphorylase [Vicinamibacteria bacterium]|nr:S-methyl-5'-thioadenosine phosphorylase [Vicinamibacteria bacterium]